MAVAILIRLPFLHVPIDSDEGGYLYVARYWTSDYRLYRDIPFDRPPGVFLIYQAMLGLLGDSVPALRLGAAIWNALTSLALFRFAREITNSIWAAAGAVLLFAVVSTNPYIEGFLAQAELFAVLPLVLAAHLTWKERWFSAGLLAGLATVIKPIGVSAFLLAAGWLLWQRAGRRAAGLLVLGYALVGVVAVGYVWTIDWPGFIAAQQMKLASLVDGPLQDRLMSTLQQTAPAWLGLAVLALVGWVSSAKPVRVFGGLWIVTSLIGMRMGREWWPHYFVQIIPALAWLTAPAFANLKRQRLPVAVALTVMGGCFVASDLPLYVADPKAVSWAVFHAPILVQQDEIAAYVQATTRPTDTIQVMLLGPSLYASAHRRAAVPHFYYYEYRHTPDAYQAVVAAVGAREPAAVVWINAPPPQWASADDFLAVLTAAGYQPRRSFGSFVVYGRP